MRIAISTGPISPGADEVEHPQQLGEVQVVVDDAVPEARRPHRGHHLGGLGRDRREGLLRQHVPPGRRGGQHEISTGVLRRAQVDHVDVRPAEQVEPAGVQPVGGQGRHPAGQLEALGRGVRDGADVVDLRVGEVGGEVVAERHVARPDEPDADPFRHARPPIAPPPPPLASITVRIRDFSSTNRE